MLTTNRGQEFIGPSNRVVYSHNLLTIRKEQFRAFAEGRVSAFKTKLAADLGPRLVAGGRVLDHKELMREVDQGIAAAQAAGFERERDIAQYVLIVATHFGSRWTEPLPKQASTILDAAGIPPERKLASLEEWAQEMKGAER